MRVWIVLAAIAGGGAIVAAQVAVQSSDAKPISRKVEIPSLNPAQDALRSYMIDRQLRLLDAAPTDAVRSAVILNNCTGMMTVLAPAQQKREVEEMQIDLYQPEPGPWDQVRNAPSMASALLKLSPDQAKKISVIAQRYFKADDAPWQEFFASEKYADMSPVQRAAAAKAFAKRAHGNLTPVQVAEKAKGKAEKELAEMRVVLTPAQRVEWDAIKAKYDGDMARAMSSARP